MGLGVLGKKLKVFVSDPKYVAKTLSQATSEAFSGRTISTHTISKEQQQQKIKPINVLTAPVALYAGVASGLVGSAAGESLKEGSRAQKFVEEHPIATTAALTTLLVAPGAALAGGLALTRSFGDTATSMAQVPPAAIPPQVPAAAVLPAMVQPAPPVMAPPAAPPPEALDAERQQRKPSRSKQRPKPKRAAKQPRKPAKRKARRPAKSRRGSQPRRRSAPRRRSGGQRGNVRRNKTRKAARKPAKKRRKTTKRKGSKKRKSNRAR